MMKKIKENTDGQFYVNTYCINCSLCPEIAPQIFASNHRKGYEYVKKQPADEEELALVREAMNICPARAIQEDG